MRHDHKRLGLSVARASWLLGVSVRRYRELEDGERYPDFEMWDQMCKLFGWSRMFASAP
jgi:Helix-turn-helix domain